MTSSPASARRTSSVNCPLASETGTRISCSRPDQSLVQLFLLSRPIYGPKQQTAVEETIAGASATPRALSGPCRRSSGVAREAEALAREVLAHERRWPAGDRAPRAENATISGYLSRLLRLNQGEGGKHGSRRRGHGRQRKIRGGVREQGEARTAASEAFRNSHLHGCAARPGQICGPRRGRRACHTQRRRKGHR